MSDWYIIIADYIDDAQSRGDKIVDATNSMRNILDSTSGATDDFLRLWLRNTIGDYLSYSTRNHQNVTKNMSVFVSKLNSYVLDSVNIDSFTINDYLQTIGEQVGAFFAEVSEQAGYPIDPENIRDIS